MLRHAAMIGIRAVWVIIRLGDLDGRRGGTLGLAHVGPPHDRQLTCTLDIAEDWTPLKFQATVCHEFGHLLGIRHADVGPTDLMTSFFNPADVVAKPQAGDIRRAQEIWGPPR